MASVASAGPRRHDRDPLDARDPRRHGRHHERRGIGRATARHVDPDRRERHPAALGRHARDGLERTSGGRCGSENAATASASRRTASSASASSCAFVELAAATRELRPLAVEPLRPVEERLVAALAHVRDDLRDALPRPSVTRRAARPAARGSTTRPPPSAARAGPRPRRRRRPRARRSGPGSARSITDGAPIPGRSARISASADAGAFIIR